MGLRGETVFIKTVDNASQTAAMVARATVAALSLVVLGGCDGLGALSTATASAAEVDVDKKIVTVAGQDVILGRAAQYCFNDRQSRVTSSGAFVVMAPCDPEDEGSEAKGLVLVNVLADDGIMKAIADHDLEAYFQSDTGRSALSRTGTPEKVTVLGTMEDDGIYYVHTLDGDGPVIPDTTADQWRVFFVAADRLVSVTVVNFVDDKMTDGLVFAHMEAIAQRIKSLN